MKKDVLHPEVEVITLFLQSEGSDLLAEALQSERSLCRILWIVENTSKLQLLEKSINLLLAVAKSKQEVVAVLIPPLMKSGLPCVLVHLLSVEIEKLIKERLPERYSILHLILETFVALFVLNNYRREICFNMELFQLVQLIKLPDKAEFANNCLIATVLTAKILADAADLALELSQDQLFLQGLLDLFPFASDDIEAQTAVWITLARLLNQIQENLTSSKLHQCVSVLTSRSEVVEDGFLNYDVDDSSEAHGRFTKIRLFTLNAIVELLRQWRNLEDQVKRALSKRWHVDEGHVDGMLHYCCKYTE